MLRNSFFYICLHAILCICSCQIGTRRVQRRAAQGRSSPPRLTMSQMFSKKSKTSSSATEMVTVLNSQPSMQGFFYNDKNLKFFNIFGGFGQLCATCLQKRIDNRTGKAYDQLSPWFSILYIYQVSIYVGRQVGILPTISLIAE